MSGKITIEPTYYFSRRFFVCDTLFIQSINKSYYGKFIKEKILEKIGEVGRFVYKKLTEIKGISEFLINPSFVQVWIKSGHKWDEIDEDIINVFLNVLEMSK